MYKGQHAWNLKIATLSAFSSACIHPERSSSALKSRQFLSFRSLSLKLWIYVGARRKAGCILDVCCLLCNTASSVNSELSNHVYLCTLKVNWLQTRRYHLHLNFAQSDLRLIRLMQCCLLCIRWLPVSLLLLWKQSGLTVTLGIVIHSKAAEFLLHAI